MTYLKVKIASMHLTGNAALWAQSLEFSLHDLAWSDLCKLISDRFERDQHNQLLRRFFHIKKDDSRRAGLVQAVESYRL